MFYIHALLALFLTSYFDDTIHLVLGFYGSEKVSYDLFTLMIPGFLFYAAAIVKESAMEASGNAPFLSQLSAIFISINVLLCIYLIPFAGTLGAAFSSLTCLLVYFFTLDVVKITDVCPSMILEFLVAGATVYLLYILLTLVEIPVFFLCNCSPTTPLSDILPVEFFRFW